MARGNTTQIITKRRQQLTRQLVLEMMDKPKISGKETTPGLLSKMMIKLNQDLDSTDEDLRHKTMDKIIKLLPFVIAKEKSPAVQLNVQNNNTFGNPQISAGKTTALAIGTMQDYLKDRDKQKRVKALPNIEDAEIKEVPSGSAKKEIKKASELIIVEELSIEFETEDDFEE